MSEVKQTPGQRLRAERERRGMSAQKAADAMHLDSWVVDALESGDYQRIGPVVFAKGHLKKYASILGLPTAEILAGFEAPPPPAAPPPAAPAPQARMRMAASAARDLLWPGIAGFAAAAVVLGGVLWWRPWHPRTVETRKATAALTAGAAANPDEARKGALTAGAAASPNEAHSGVLTAGAAASPKEARNGVLTAGAAASSKEARNEARAPGPAGDPGTPAATPAASAAVPAAAYAAVGSAAGTPAAAAAGEAAGSGRARLRLSFSADSWVVVHDAAGRRIFAGNGRANSVRTLAGSAPMRVYLGFASGVQLEINHHAVAIGPQFFAGDVARFEAGADGVLRRDTHGAQTQNAAHPRG